jgi:hypothetical protein
MSRGPLPNPNARRRNAPTIPTTALPAGGRKGRAPKVPAGYELHTEGMAWWRWAWSLPQAVAWDTGAHYALARRAQLEDVQAALQLDDTLDLRDLLAGADKEAIRNVEFALSTLKRAATGGLSVAKEMRELDRRFGLDPKAMAELRWTIVAEEPAERPAPERKRHLRAVGE